MFSIFVTCLLCCFISSLAVPSRRHSPKRVNPHNRKPTHHGESNNNPRVPEGPIVAGWFANWAQYRTEPYDVEPASLEPVIPSLDILFYGFAYFCPDSSMFQPYWVTELGYCDDKEAFDVIYIEPNDPTYFAQFVSYKESLNANMKIVLSIGGWNFPSAYFSGMTASSESRTAFISSALAFIQEYELDGVDIDWEYPLSAPRVDDVEINCDTFDQVTDAGGNADDYDNFVTLMKEMRMAFGDDYLITFCGQAGLENVKKGFDLVSLVEYVDFINIMSYDYNVPQTNDSSISEYTGPNQPLYSPSSAVNSIPQWNINQTIQGYLELGAPASQILIGIAYYGHLWMVENVENKGWQNYGLKSEFDGGGCCGPMASTYGGPPGQYCIQCGEYGYYEILNAGFDNMAYIDNETMNYISYLNAEGNDGYTPANTWITYQGPETIKAILNYCKKFSIRGAFGFDLTQDTYDTSTSTWTYELTDLLEKCVKSSC